MNLQSYYEDSYRGESSRGTVDLKTEATTYTKGLYNFVLDSKDRFLPSVDWQGMRVCEMGSGRGGLGLQLARLGASVTLVDFSPSALDQARELFVSEGFDVDILVADVTHPDVTLFHKYDLIVDSHLLHCLVEDPDRISYYRLVSEYLTGRGIFVAETMVHRKAMQVADGFMFDQRNILWQMFGQWTPIRRILDSLDLEAEVKAAHFNIAYFYYYAQFGFVPHRSFMDLPAEILPAAVRMVLTKDNDLQRSAI